MADNTHSDVRRLPFERAIEELESIVKRLEEGKVPFGLLAASSVIFSTRASACRSSSSQRRLRASPRS